MIKRHMRALVAAVAVGVVAIGTGVFVADAAASDPSVAGSKQFVGAPAALACGAPVDVRVTVTGTAGVSGTATDVMLVLDLSGSMAGTKLAQLKNAASALVQALDIRDGANNGTLGLGNSVGIVTYKDQAGTANDAVVLSGLSSSESALESAIAGLTNPSSGSTHAAGINRAASTLATSTKAKAIVLVSDGLGNQSAANTAATNAKAAGISIATIGIGGDVATAALQSWASSASSYQSGTPGPIDANELIADIGAAVSVPAQFTLTETPGTTFSLAGAGSSPGPTPGSLQWTGSLADGEQATIEYTATRNGSNLFSVTEEEVSSSALTVTGGTASLTPASLRIDVLPCDATALLDQETCTGGSCTGGGTTTAGLQYSVNAGTPAAGTELFVAALGSAPPAGSCPGFDANTNGVQFDIRPLTTAGTFEIRIPKAALGSKKWWQTDVCIGTNLRFITKIGSLSNLRPGASNVDSRWWGLLPSVPRYTVVNGKLVKGPWITQRTVNSAGDAIVRFTMPYVTGSENVTTNGAAAYDPKVFGG